MAKVILRVQGTESTLAAEDLTIERICAEARAVDLEKFAVMRNGEEIARPEDFIKEGDFVKEEGDIFVILPADYEDVEIDVNGEDNPMNDPANDPE
ncbi:MAG: hypothetical protein COA93_04175 [Alphaproteobacteria bacterium]|nr:MAG: hypothetical protein COA93_04175 [Alphaproteobacteria bacterium]